MHSILLGINHLIPQGYIFSATRSSSLIPVSCLHATNALICPSKIASRGPIQTVIDSGLIQHSYSVFLNEVEIFFPELHGRIVEHKAHAF
uniref:Uncharacterized protein n=1 Tax=Picea sitchensis TaxID=3332 RepID=D5A8A8_PICSI|nr:unknown [Picea sitchensis]